MTAFYRYFDGPLDPLADRWLTQMITLSGNDPADWLMQRIDRTLGPIKVTDTLKSLGLGSSFIAGYFHLGSELLRDYQTPGNSRPDINTSPDRYNQATASDMGMLLTDVYQCANGGGTLLAAFPGQIKQAECQHMLELLSQNKIGVLIEAGVPDGTRVAHKHGWTDSPLTQVSDAGIVFSPAGDFVVSIFLWNSHEMIWEPSSKLVAELACRLQLLQSSLHPQASPPRAERPPAFIPYVERPTRWAGLFDSARQGRSRHGFEVQVVARLPTDLGHRDPTGRQSHLDDVGSEIRDGRAVVVE